MRCTLIRPSLARLCAAMRSSRVSFCVGRLGELYDRYDVGQATVTGYGRHDNVTVPPGNQVIPGKHP